MLSPTPCGASYCSPSLHNIKRQLPQTISSIRLWASGFDGSGTCVLRTVNTPMFYEPDGTGYVKEVMWGAKTIENLKVACTEAVYQKLLTKFCKSRREPVQEEIYTYRADGSPYQHTCSSRGCGFIYCHQAGAVTQNAVSENTNTMDIAEIYFNKIPFDSLQNTQFLLSYLFNSLLIIAINAVIASIIIYFILKLFSNISRFPKVLLSVLYSTFVSYVFGKIFAAVIMSMVIFVSLPGIEIVGICLQTIFFIGLQYFILQKEFDKYFEDDILEFEIMPGDTFAAVFIANSIIVTLYLILSYFFQLWNNS